MSKMRKNERKLKVFSAQSGVRIYNMEKLTDFSGVCIASRFYCFAPHTDFKIWIFQQVLEFVSYNVPH